MSTAGTRILSRNEPPSDGSGQLTDTKAATFTRVLLAVMAGAGKLLRFRPV